jgi:serine phosphatase RsbU (regulator of sigma subunit)/HAMP domain-containing protein/uncharacterized protein (UPF0333 family)
MNVFFKNLQISLKFKIAFFVVLLVIVMMGTVTHIFTIQEITLRKEQVKLRMERLANNIATIRSVETQDWNVYQTYIDNQLRLNPDIVYIAIFDENGDLKVHALNTQWLDLDTTRSLDTWEQAGIVWRLDQRQIADESQKDLEAKSVNIIIGQQSVGAVHVGFSLIDLNDALRKNLYRNLNLALIFIILAIVVSLFMSQRIVKPLGKLTKAMAKISEGDLKQEIHITSRDEIGRMADTFNFMTKGLNEKKSIEELGRDLSFAVELDKTAQLITERITLALNAEQGILMVKESEAFRIISAYPSSFQTDMNLPCDPSVEAHFLKTPNPLSPGQLANLPELSDSFKSFWQEPCDSLVVPMIVKEKLIGLFLLGAKKSQAPYKEDEKHFLKTLIGQGSFAIENALLIEELTEKERLRRELEIARSVQQSLLPPNNPHIEGLDIDGICIPTSEVGGDYYDFFSVNDGTMGIVIADVTGKGTSSAFYMAVVKGMMLSLAPLFTSPKKLLIELNRRLFGVMDRNMFVTMNYAVVDVEKSVLILARAGHNALLMRNAGASETECFIPAGIGLGLEHGEKFEKNISELQISYKPGDVLLFYTDGISEAMNNQKEQYGEHRLIDLMNQLDEQDARAIREYILQTINDFVQDAPQHDDITMVIIKALPSEE